MIKSGKISIDEVKVFSERNSLEYFETSAKEFVNIDEAFVKIAEKIIEKMENKVIDPMNEV